MTSAELSGVHERDLATRIVNQAVADFVETATATALAGTGDLNERERGARQAIREMRNLHLSGWHYKLTPTILDQLRRAGLLISREDA